MNGFIEVKGITLPVKTLIEIKKYDFISDEFLNTLTREDRIEEYEEKLAELKFNYPIRTPQMVGFGHKDINLEITKIFAKDVSNFLEKPKKENETLTDKLAISENQLSATYCALINSIARIQNSKDDNFVRFWDVKRMIKNDYFLRNLENTIEAYTVNSLANYAKKHFIDLNHKKNDIIYTKLDLEAKQEERAEENTQKTQIQTDNKKIKIIYLPSPKKSTINEDIKKNSKTDDVYKEIPALNNRKNSGEELGLECAEKYLKSIGMNKGEIQKQQEIIRFIKTPRGQEFLNYKKKPTNRFLRFVYTNFDLIKEAYEK